MKKMWLVIVILIIIGIGACGKGKDNIRTEWGEGCLAAFLPYPEGCKHEVMIENEDTFYASVDGLNDETYEKYVEQIKACGFTVDGEKDNISYCAYNEEGYEIELVYAGDSMSLDLKAPKEIKEIRWPKSEIAQLLPVPKSTVGVIEWEASYGFVIYLGETTLDDYNDYADACADMGFTIDYQRGDDFYHADNEEGYHLSLRYDGYNTMFVRIDEPDEEETKEEIAEEAEEEPEEEEEKKDSTTVDPDLKAFLDEYEEFMYDYIDFMAEYEESDDVFAMLDDYTKLMTKYAEFAEELEEYDPDEMTAADAAYYLEVTNRVNQKMLESL